MPATIDQLHRLMTGVVCDASLCWVWQRNRNKNGYGESSYGGRRMLAHRLSWVLHNGPIPAGACVLHRCDNPPCVNPEHLFLGSHKDNSDDKIAKGRQRHPRFKKPEEAIRRGESNPFAKLTESDVLDMRAIRAFGGSVADIATAYGINLRYAFKVVNREVWGHLP